MPRTPPKSSKTIKLLIEIDVERDEDRKLLFDMLQSCGLKLYKIGKALSSVERLDSSIKDIYAAKNAFLDSFMDAKGR